MGTNQNNYFSTKNIWKIAFPIVLGSLAQDIITVVDTAFIGRLGEVELGGAAIGGIFYLSIVMLGWGFGLGVQILIARKYGENNIQSINRIFFHSLLILLGLASTLFFIIHNYNTQIFSSLIQSPLIANQSLKFIDLRIFGIFAAFANINFRAFYIGIAHTKIIIYTTALMAVVNIVLDYLLIFGIGIFPRMNIEGAAIASIISEFSALLFFIGYTLINNKSKIFNLFHFEKIKLNIIKEITQIASPMMVQNFISFSAWFIFFLFVEKMGQAPLAISNIIRSIYIVILVPIFGFAAATNTLVSYSIGNNSTENIWPIIKRAMIMAICGIALIIIVGIFFPRQIIGIYTNIDSVIEATVPAFYVIMIASFSLAFGLILFQAVSGTGKTFIALIIEIIVISFYLLGVYLIANSKSPSIEWVWSIEIFYGLGLGLLSVVYLKWGHWRLKTD